MTVDLNAMEIGVHEAGFGENAPIANGDCATAPEMWSIQEHVVADGDDRVNVVRPRGYDVSHTYIVAEDHASGSPQRQAPGKAKVSARGEAKTAHPTPRPEQEPAC